MNGIKVSELFFSVQGEGQYIGTPSVFLRTFGCNFTCSGFGMPGGEKSQERFQIDPTKYTEFKQLPLVKTGCDSYPSWDARFKHLSPVLEISGIADQIEKLLPTGKFSNDVHLILTGGEPLLGWQKQYPALLNEIHRRKMNLCNLTFETNGTQKISDVLQYSLAEHHNMYGMMTTFSVSPKLTVSGERWEAAIKPEVIQEYMSVRGSNVYLKFVVATENDVDDVYKAVEQYRSVGFNGTVYLMPIGGTEDGYYLNNKKVAQLALSNGFRYSPRLQVSLWGNGWNT